MPVAGLLSRRAGQLSALLAMLVFFAAQLTGALLPNAPLFITASAAGFVLDLYLHHKQPGLLALLSRVRFDVPTRQLLRDMLLVLGLVQTPGLDPLAETPLVLCLLGSYAAHFACQAAAVLVRRNRTLPVITRNIDVSALGLTAAPPKILARQPSRRLLHFMVPATFGLLMTAATVEPLWGIAGVAGSLLLFGAGTGYIASWLLPGKRTPNEQKVLNWLNEWLTEYRPSVAMYFSGGTSSAYQANMWLSTLDQLDGKPLIVLRERFMVQKIESTDVPIVCIPKVAHLMTLEHSTLKMMLHPANSGKTSQVLRIPSIKHSFINHGESDKLSSCNPYAKAYDEVWVAGPAARERYQLADIGVDDRDVVEVGRPQLAPILPYAGAPAADRLTTVLYAPTWEGWTDDPGNTSVILAGENIVRELLADARVRLIYKPHPMTGSVDPRAGAANQRIQQMIAAANVERAAVPGHTRPGAETADELARRTVALDQLATSAFRRSADELERMALQSVPDGGRADAVTAAREAWEEAYWASYPEWEHLVITGPRPGIYPCFNQADLLISDVSSVVSDYLSSEKPYAVANTSGLSEDEFRSGFPTVRAATILSPSAAEVPELLASTRSSEPDALADERAALKEHLLGPADPPSMVRFEQAVRDLCGKADARRERVARRSAEMPPQRERHARAEAVAEENQAEAAQAEETVRTAESVEPIDAEETGGSTAKSADAANEDAARDAGTSAAR
ncbi:hypothetical protein MTQ01_07540 [Streptomyces sp. XM4193]|uniref:hypothetical protein n=1 Tax=Streptomyces sp. XM4193 TaxID=2929782 RepID=UPI001FF8E4DF|nr:hypothetical protein [Streptomyces sp. XM4193]MCK1795859.1 hypothetical protein [Streptomyces sp. XM4193]